MSRLAGRQYVAQGEGNPTRHRENVNCCLFLTYFAKLLLARLAATWARIFLVAGGKGSGAREREREQRHDCMHARKHMFFKRALDNASCVSKLQPLVPFAKLSPTALFAMVSSMRRRALFLQVGDRIAIATSIQMVRIEASSRILQKIL